jgi:hypothetical protein
MSITSEMATRAVSHLCSRLPHIVLKNHGDLFMP